MQISLANLASPGKSSAAPGRNGSDSLNSLEGPQANRAGDNENNSVDGTHAFGATLHDAIHRSEACAPDSAASRPQTARHEHAATPAVPAHEDAPARDEDEAPAADAQLDGGLQAFVNSLQAPVTAMAVSTTAVTADATAAATDAATASEADGVTALAADADGKGKAYAFGLDDAHGALARAQNGAGHASADQADAADAADAAKAAGKDKLDVPDWHASLRAREVAAGKVAQEFRAALNDAQSARPGLQEALTDSGSSGSSGSLAQAIAAATAGTPAAAANTAAVPGQAAHITPHLYAAQWQDAFGQQVVWMAKNEQQIASLTMNPPDLGPVRVTLSIIDGQASAAFVSLQPEVRQAIQDAVPRLKEMLAEAGLQLQQASVDSGDAGRQSASRAQGEDGARRIRSAGSAADADDAAMTTDAASLRTARSIAASRLVDLFA